MKETARRLLKLLDDEQAAAARYPFEDDGARRWLEYRPEARPGVSLSGLNQPARKAARQLLATVLRPHAYAQAMAIGALEEVLDRAEGGHRNRHSEDYWVSVFGEPGDERWGWRFEGHHLSVSITVEGDEVYPTPVFLGANPATVSYQGHPVLRPLALEEEIARALLDALDPALRGQAVVDTRAPSDILSARAPRAVAVEPLGVPAHKLAGTARDLLDRLVGVYLDRLAPDLTRAESARIDPDSLHFAWAGPGEPGHGHYYRVQATDLLIEYDNTQDGANHAHTVLRRPARDFGGDPLAEHLHS
jgi:hypothetical protein